MRKNNEVFPGEFKQAMQASRENPDTNIESDPRLASYCTLDPLQPPHPLKTLKQKRAAGLKAIKSITMRDYIGFKFLIRPERIQYIEDWYNLPDSEKETHPQDAPWFNEPINNSFTPAYGKTLDTINVNLRLPDTFLIEGFKEYLAEKRKEVQVYSRKHLHESDFNNWINYGVLPYLDLIIWGIETETQIPNRVLADVLYPNGEKNEETIRKTTSQLAEALLDSKNIFQLIMQATKEIAEKNTI